MEVANQDIGQWAAIIVAAITCLTYIKVGSNKEKDVSVKVARLEERVADVESSTQINAANFKIHETMHDKQLEVLSEIRSDGRVNMAEIRLLKDRLDRDFARRTSNIC